MNRACAYLWNVLICKNYEKARDSCFCIYIYFFLFSFKAQRVLMKCTVRACIIIKVLFFQHIWSKYSLRVYDLFFRAWSAHDKYIFEFFFLKSKMHLLYVSVVYFQFTQCQGVQHLFLRLIYACISTYIKIGSICLSRFVFLSFISSSAPFKCTQLSI